jgi:hypothetical protein
MIDMGRVDMGRFQLVRWNRWVGFRKLPPYPSSGRFKGKVYRWRVCLGFFELRRWGD